MEHGVPNGSKEPNLRWVSDDIHLLCRLGCLYSCYPSYDGRLIRFPAYASFALV